eukprot:534141-Amphidinium_carterae.1
MGFVCISEKYWCWPAKHLRFPGSASSDWGKKLVPTQCPGSPFASQSFMRRGGGVLLSMRPLARSS